MYFLKNIYFISWFKGSVWKIFPAKKFDEERAKELPDRNLSFSKNFLEEYD
jgi:hypothetical protein